MAADPDKRVRSRTLSSRNMDKEMDLLRQYSNRYLPQTHTGGSYRPGQFSSYANTSTSTSTAATTAPTTSNTSYARSNRSNDSMNSNASNSSLSSGLSSSKSPSPSPQSRSTYELNNDLSNSSSSSKNGGADKHERRRSNLINTNTLHSWDESSLDSTSQEMEEAMRNMVESMQTRVNEQSRVLSDIEERATHDNNFAKPENADRWSILEVCHWLNSIHFQKYVNNFNSLGIDGSILLHDLDENILGNELGIKKIHLKKCLREITKLKEAVQTRARMTEEEKCHRVEELEKQVVSLQQSNLKLKENIETAREQLKRMPLQPQQIRSPRSQSQSPSAPSMQYETGSDVASKTSVQNNESNTKGS